MDDTELIDFLTKEGYKSLKEIPGRGLCGLFPFMYTVAIVYGIDKYGYKGRYCYAHKDSALMMIHFHHWDGVNDPLGPWIKHKGNVEYSNPKVY